MIYLIGGPPRSGKTRLAKALARDLKISWISADTLEGLALHFTPTNVQKRKFPKNFIRKQTQNSNDLMYAKYTARQIMTAYAKQAKATWEVISTLIEWLIGEHHNYIIEGHQVAPELAYVLLQKHSRQNIRVAFLTRHKMTDIVTAATQNTDPTDWFIGKTKNPNTYTKIAKMIALYGDYLKRQADKYGFRNFDMDRNFSAQLLQAKNYLKMTGCNTHA